MPLHGKFYDQCQKPDSGRMKTLMPGVGNTSPADDGADVYAIQVLKEQYDLPATEFLDGGNLSFTLAGAIAEATYLIIFGEPRRQNAALQEATDPG